ncbi:MAG: hypothetical protein V3U27_16420 [Candidatus Tectomicrobia bacterium]
MARLDRLGAAKAVARLGAMIGRQFPYDLLHALGSLDAATLQRQLGTLVEAEVFSQQGIPPQATYRFKHALLQDAAYQSLPKRTRQQYHQRIARLLPVRFPEMVQHQPELLAHHSTEAGLSEQALHYWQLAGQHAIEHSAYVEAMAHLTQGLTVLQTLPDTRERAQCELTLHMALGQALAATHGWATHPRS